VLEILSEAKVSSSVSVASNRDIHGGASPGGGMAANSLVRLLDADMPFARPSLDSPRHKTAFKFAFTLCGEMVMSGGPGLSSFIDRKSVV